MNITKEQIREWLSSHGYKIHENTYLPTNEIVYAISGCINDLAPKWVSVDGYENIPKGVWLVRLEGEDSPEVADNTGSICIIGNRFAFDAERITSYIPLPEPPK
jgi:hypothetical protein